VVDLDDTEGAAVEAMWGRGASNQNLAELGKERKGEGEEEREEGRRRLCFTIDQRQHPANSCAFDIVYIFMYQANE
jgi:hypothetical protein